MSHYKYSDGRSHYYFIATKQNPTAQNWNKILIFSINVKPTISSALQFFKGLILPGFVGKKYIPDLIIS